MKVIEKLENRLFTKKNGLYIFIILLYLLLMNEINLWLNNFIITKFNQLSNSIISLNLLFFILLILTIFNLIKKVNRNYYFSAYKLIIPTFIYLIFLLYRFDIPYFRFWDFKTIYSNILYFDIFTLYIISNIILCWYSIRKSKRIKNNKKENSFILLDDPIRIQKSDILNNSNLAVELFKIIQQIQPDNRAFIIGIESSWGNGKTSFINLLQSVIKENNLYIQINIKTWVSSNWENLQSSFFLQIQNELIKYSNNHFRLLYFLIISNTVPIPN